MIEWNEPAAVLRVTPYGEADALVHVLTAGSGRCRGLVRGGLSRRQAATWQPGNLVQARWVARLEHQLGTLTGELVHAAAALAMQDPAALAILSAACAVAEGALPEHEPHPEAFRGLLHVIAHAGQGITALAALIEWELGLLRALGYGLDLRQCAVSGRGDTLAFVSPRTGRAVTAEEAGAWAPRLLPLPRFLTEDLAPTEASCADGLALTAHFLARDVFGVRHVPLPPARERLAGTVFPQGLSGPTVSTGESPPIQ